MKLGLTLPNFRDEPEPALAVARAAEAAGLDGVFGFDHLFRRTKDGARRPALEGMTLLGAVAAETSRIAFGPLVARASLRPPATLAVTLDTLARVAPGRLVATIGAGDSQSREENETFGLPQGTLATRVKRLEDAIDATVDRGYPVWVGGASGGVGMVAAARADGWNRWGPPLARFEREARSVREAHRRDPFTVSWAGLFVVDRTERGARAKAQRLPPTPEATVGGPEQVAEVVRAYGAAGAEWVIVGPIDSSDPDNAVILGEMVKPLLT
ncbi:MAG TPA: LLM class flavin-dependent oxidoreductase [Acidimicrobiia bacterium]|nr:LLM class flavin-dependent oxidoreductase [Acidimicrobiia bacterium]